MYRLVCVSAWFTFIVRSLRPLYRMKTWFGVWQAWHVNILVCEYRIKAWRREHKHRKSSSTFFKSQLASVINWCDIYPTLILLFIYTILCIMWWGAMREYIKGLKYTRLPWYISTHWPKAIDWPSSRAAFFIQRLAGTSTLDLYIGFETKECYDRGDSEAWFDWVAIVADETVGGGET
jgi:hypothetical protein